MPASIQELVERLSAEGLLPSEYSVGPPFRDNTLCLKEESDCWRIFFYDTGREDDLGEFSLFSEASQEFLEMLRRKKR